MDQKPRVVIVGAGFGGLKAAETLKKAPVDVLLVDRHNYHTFQPLLYQVATAMLEPEEVAHSVRGIYQKQQNFNFRLAVVQEVDWESKTVLVEEGEPIPYDFLILAAGASTNYFGVEGVEENAFPLKSMAEAIALRNHIMRQFERADAEPALIEEGLLTFVIVGGGPTGVEMAGALVELFDKVLAKDFPRLDVSNARVILVEAMERLLTPFHEQSSENAREALQRRGVELLLGETVVRATAEAVWLKSGRVIPTRTLIWAAGVRANPLAERLNLQQTRGGRIVVKEDLSVPGDPHVFVIGDMAASKDAQGNLHPQLAQVALQGAKHVAKQIQRQLRGQPTQRFVYRDPGIMATIGRAAAVAELPFGLRFTGFIAWLMWLFLHLIYLVGFRNRLNVLVNWAWNYITYDRSARLIFELEPEAIVGERTTAIESNDAGDKQLEHGR
ncbi:MAG: NAD(P)/FAD-dependent oxidoreductase [Ardenticatenaceae bacterium]